MASRKTKDEKDQQLETTRTAYLFESSVWGQSIILEEPRTGIVLLTASDFDSGQTVRVGIDVQTFERLCQTGMSLIAAGILQGKGQGQDSESA